MLKTYRTIISKILPYDSRRGRPISVTALRYAVFIIMLLEFNNGYYLTHVDSEVSSLSDI